MKRFILIASTGLVLFVGLMFVSACSSTESKNSPPTTVAAPKTPDITSTPSSGVGSDSAAKATAKETVIRLTAKRFEYSPSEIKVKKGVPVVIELTSKDRIHGFNIPDFKVRTDVHPNQVTRVRFTPDKTGSFTFACDIYCGSGHEEMSGTLTVVD